ncbi:helix-turn-helix domain-containing protein [Parabacteroides sp. PF5-9]|uniref:helix-turn-helix domain-containing protein n=1 Tax=Parabacteroides sp. PF5-9 TaxID=1742404 RepID=UPI002473275E|nr:helix-turn-helix domain-containing protein [Parabacteroides sp. PF5-9]MDH6356249.1 transcriptional regulator with XRE-family HTH domain [Parabacteroides sp. PF5-9]
MKKTNIIERFVELLLQKIPKRSLLVTEIADILKIERESASRRLSGRVLFTVEEVYKLAAVYGISLDGLLKEEENLSSFSLMPPTVVKSFDTLINQTTDFMQYNWKLYETEVEMGTVFDSLPLEFCIGFPELCKFLYFKWGHFFIGSEEFYHYSSWHLPPAILNYHRKLKEVYHRYESILYIWDTSVIRNLMSDILYFQKLYLLTAEEIKQIKQDIHNVLNNLEALSRGSYDANISLCEGEFTLYVASTNIGMYYSYHFSKTDCFCFFKRDMLQAPFNYDRTTCEKLREWVHAMTKVSTLISGSGGKERRLFFEEQHRIVDEIAN